MSVKKWRKEKMVKHIILWKLKEEYSEEKKQQIKAEIKEGLEGLGRVNTLSQTDRSKKNGR